MNISVESPSTSVSMPLMNERTLRPVICSIGAQNSRTVAYSKEHAHVPQALVLAHLDQVALGGRERVLEDDRQGVATGPVRARLRRPATELLLVDPDHRVRDLRQDARARVNIVGHMLLVGGHAATFPSFGAFALLSKDQGESVPS